MKKEYVYAALGGLAVGVLIANMGFAAMLPFVGTLGMSDDTKKKLGIA